MEVQWLSEVKLMRVSDVMVRVRMVTGELHPTREKSYRIKIRHLIETACKQQTLRKISAGADGPLRENSQALYTTLPEGEEPQEWELTWVQEKEQEEHRQRQLARRGVLPAPPVDMGAGGEVGGPGPAPVGGEGPLVDDELWDGGAGEVLGGPAAEPAPGGGEEFLDLWGELGAGNFMQDLGEEDLGEAGSEEE